MKRSTKAIIGLCAFYVPVICGLIYATTLPPPLEAWGRFWPAAGAFMAAQSGYYFGRLVEYVKANGGETA